MRRGLLGGLGAALLAGCTGGGAGGETLAVHPAAATLAPQQVFTFAVPAAGDEPLTWTLVSGAGTLDANGTYQAPNEIPAAWHPEIRVRAALAAEPERAAEAVVSVAAAPLDPPDGPSTGGTEVTLAGEGFRPGTHVVFGGVPATSVVVESTSLLRAVTPPRASLGPVDVDVATEGATGYVRTRYPNAFRYHAEEVSIGDPDLFRTPCDAQIPPTRTDLDDNGVDELVGSCAGALTIFTWSSAGLSTVMVAQSAGAPSQLLLSDVDSDGDDDLVGLFGGMRVQVFSNDGGSLSPGAVTDLSAITSGASQMAAGLVAGDDAIPDVVVVQPDEYGLGFAWIARGLGDGTFVVDVPGGFANPRGAHSVAIADMDGDMDDDIVFPVRDVVDPYNVGGADYFTITGFEIHRNDGMDAFALETFTRDWYFDPLYNGDICQGNGDCYGYLGGLSRVILVDDVVGDALPDVVVGSFDQAFDFFDPIPTLETHTNSSGAFDPAALRKDSEAYIGALRAGELDGQGPKEVIAYVNGGFTIHSQSGTGGGGFALLNSVPAAADLDGNGEDELVVLGGNLLEVYRRTASFDFASTGLPAAGTPGSQPREIVTGDDGRIVTAVRLVNSGALVVSDPDFGEMQTFTAGFRSPVRLHTSADVDADGFGDVLLLDDGAFTSSRGSLWIFPGTDGPSFLTGRRLLLFEAPARSMSVADFDNDGRDDVVVGVGGSEPALQVMWSTTSSLTFPQVVALDAEPAVSIAADLDELPGVELVVAQANGAAITLYELVRGGDALSFALPAVPGATAVSRIHSADIDGDVLPEVLLLVSSGGSAVVCVLHNDGGRSFSLDGSVSVSGQPTDFALADLDRDGVLDVVLSTLDYQISIFPGNRDGSFGTAWPPVIMTQRTRALWVGDATGDGLPDITSAAEGGTLWRLENRSH